MGSYYGQLEFAAVEVSSFLAGDILLRSGPYRIRVRTNVGVRKFANLFRAIANMFPGQIKQ